MVQIYLNLHPTTAGEDVYFQWATSVIFVDIYIPKEDVYSIVIHPFRECTFSPAIGMLFARNAHPH